MSCLDQLDCMSWQKGLLHAFNGADCIKDYFFMIILGKP